MAHNRGMSTPQWKAPSTRDEFEILRDARRIAVVGASANPSRPSHGVLAYLVEQTDYELYPVNPGESEILGLTVYPSLADLPHPPDLVDVFRRRSELPSVTDDAINCGASVLWFQLGLADDASAGRAVAAGLTVVQNRCIEVEHLRHAEELRRSHG